MRFSNGVDKNFQHNFVIIIGCYITKICITKIKHRTGQRCFELLALIGSPQLSFQRYSQLNKHLKDVKMLQSRKLLLCKSHHNNGDIYYDEMVLIFFMNTIANPQVKRLIVTVCMMAVFPKECRTK